MTMLISQELFDESLLENEELFDDLEGNEDECVKETIEQLTKNCVDEKEKEEQLFYLTLTHPHSTLGKQQRSFRQQIKQSIQQISQIISNFIQQQSKEEEELKSSLENELKSISLILEQNPIQIIYSLIQQQQQGDQQDFIEQLLLLLQFLQDDDDEKSLFIQKEEKIDLLSTLFIILSRLFHQSTIFYKRLYKANKNNNNNNEKNHTFAQWKLAADYVTPYLKTLPLLQLQQQHSLLQYNHNIDDDDEDKQKSFLFFCQNLIFFIHQACRTNPLNKQVWATKSALQNILHLLTQLQQHYTTITSSSSSLYSHYRQVIVTISNLFTVLCRYHQHPTQQQQHQQQHDPSVDASHHSIVLELCQCGVISILSRLIIHHEQQQQQQQQDLESLAAFYAALRVFAIHDDVVQSIVALGLLDRATQTFLLQVSALQQQQQQQEEEDATNNSTTTTTNDQSKDEEEEQQYRLQLVLALVGLLRNVSGNDDVKTSLCLSGGGGGGGGGMTSIVEPLITLARCQPHYLPLQQSISALFGAMALRKPRNATEIIKHGGHFVILSAIERAQQQQETNNNNNNTIDNDVFILFRLGALAIRNLASRATLLEKQLILEARAEIILRRAASSSLGGYYADNSVVDSVYAALRDLGITVQTFTIIRDDEKEEETTVIRGPQMFGQVKSNFRPIYNE